MKSIALFDDGSRVSNYLKLHFQNKLGFSVTRVYSRKELEYKVRSTQFDIVISPTGFPVYPTGNNGIRLCLFWSSSGGRKKCAATPDNLSFLFEIETPDTSLSYHSCSDEPLREQFDTLARLLVRIEKYHRDFSLFQADAEVLQSIVENSGTGILYLVRNTIRWANPESLHILGRTGTELIGRGFSSVFSDDQHYREVFGLISRNRDTTGWGTARCALARNSGEVLECTIRMRRLHPMDSQKGYIVLIQDDREKIYLERAISEYHEKMAQNEMKYLEMLQRMDQIVIRTDPDGAITFWNARAGTILGYTIGEVTGKNIVSLVTDTGSRSAKDMAVLLHDPVSGGNAPMHILEVRTRAGEYLWTAWSTLPCRDLSGHMAGIVWIGQDISGTGSSGPFSARPGTWKKVLLEGTDVKEEVFDIIFHAAIELGRGGRESRKIGTSFVIGDSERVMTNSRQCSINSFQGKDRGDRMIQDQGTIENIKNLALLDGAFIIAGSGYVHASSRHLLADASGINIPQGFGTRHASVAAMTAITRSVGIIVSESGGTVTIVRDGRIIKQIEP